MFCVLIEFMVTSQNYVFLYVSSDEAIAQSGMPTSKNSLEMENHVYMKAKSKVSRVAF